LVELVGDVREVVQVSGRTEPVAYGIVRIGIRVCRLTDHAHDGIRHFRAQIVPEIVPMQAGIRPLFSTSARSGLVMPLAYPPTIRQVTW